LYDITYNITRYKNRWIDIGLTKMQQSNIFTDFDLLKDYLQEFKIGTAKFDININDIYNFYSIKLTYCSKDCITFKNAKFDGFIVGRLSDCMNRMTFILSDRSSESGRLRPISKLSILFVKNDSI